MILKSIRGRLLIWLGFLLTCILSGFGITAYQLHRFNRLDQIDKELEQHLTALSADFRGRTGPGQRERPRFEPETKGRLHGPGFSGRGPGTPGGGPTDRRFFKPELQPETLSLFDSADEKGFYFTIWSRDGEALKTSTNAPAGLEFPGDPVQGDTRTHNRTRQGFREAFHFTERDHCILVGRSIAPDLKALQGFGWWLFVAGCGVLGIGLWGGGILASRALRPVHAISAAATRISAGKLSERINVADTDSELGYLARVLNSTFARLEAAFAEQKQFTANASHEIRTPLAVLISEAQTTLSRERTAAEYKETLEACLDTAQQMRRLTESLLQLARFDAGQEIIERESFDLAQTARDCVDLVRPLAAQRQIQIQCELQPATVRGDAVRIGQVIINLLTNAIHYNKPSGQIHACTQTQNGEVLLQVNDTGPGIKDEDLPHIFERFYRADKSRSNAQGRNGLGLAICKAIVTAHGGNIEAANRSGAGATFTVRLPPGPEQHEE